MTSDPTATTPQPTTPYPLGGTLDRRPFLRVSLLVWGLARLPVILLIAYSLRTPIVGVLENLFGLARPTLAVIDILSTPLIRLVSFITLFVTVGTWFHFASKSRPWAAYASTLAFTFGLIAFGYSIFNISPRRALLAMALFITNLLPVVKGLSHQQSRTAHVALFLPTISELFFFRIHLKWIQRLFSREHPALSQNKLSILSFGPGLAIACAGAACLMSGGQLAFAEQKLRLSSAATIMARDNFNGLEITPDGNHLLASGHGLERLHKYDLRAIDKPPLLADAPTGYAQGFAYDPSVDQIYVFARKTGMLYYLSASTLTLERSVSVPDISDGDAWMSVDIATDSISIASEADRQTGTPFVVVDRTTGAVRDRLSIDSGVTLKHPQKPFLYLSFFRRSTGILVYDFLLNRIVKSAPADERVERMAFWDKANELLVTSPMRSRIVRYDAHSLEIKGFVGTMFGVRSVAVDSTRDLMLCASIATGKVEVINLETGRSLASYYLGPWLREIRLNHETAKAYVSSNGALYELNYLAGVQKTRKS